jgi:catechol 2,3-dioxygenase
MEPTKPAPPRAVTPQGLSHVVLNVRDLETSHRFYTEVLGFRLTGELRPRDSGLRMRFYSGSHGGEPAHHDLALVHRPELPEPAPWSMTGTPVALNHIAVRMPDRESWLAQLAFLRERGVEFRLRINHGMTHSVYLADPNGYGVEVLYELPEAVWMGDVNEALNYSEALPVAGDAALADSTDYPVFRKP